MFRALTRAENAGRTVAVVLAIAYAAVPAVVGQLTGTEAFADLIALALVSSVVVWIGSTIPVLDWVHSRFLPRIAFSTELTLGLVWVSFAAFVALVLATAPSIPLIDALRGADPRTIAEARELFLKARTGWQASFVYINALYCGALLPYTLAVLFLTRSRYRWLCFGFFFLYSISFVEKAFFFKAVLPLAVLVLQGRIKTVLNGPALLAGLMAVLLLLTRAAGSEAPDDAGLPSDFFSTAFVPSGAANKVIWRAVAIPVVTAADGLRLFNEEFGGRPLGGATSTFLAALFGQRRIEFERLTFASQFGQNETETGSANSVFFIEAMVNFGWPGVIVFALAVGLMLRIFAKTRDDALRALWVLFALDIYASGLIGVLLSNGFALVIPIALISSWEAAPEASDPSASLVAPAEWQT